MTSRENRTFDYRTLRLVIGLIAFLLPFVVSIIANTTLASISGSYYTEARDWFVGLLFIVGGFLLAYNGHTQVQANVSKVASVAAVGIAVFPTACDKCGTTITSIIHFTSATILFSALAYFCLGPFREQLIGQGGKKRLRRNIYLLCGVTMIVCMLSIAGSNIILPSEVVQDLRIVYWGEAIALGAFGVAWFVSGKALGLFADKDEMLKLY